jgi:hypothetical protein
VSVGTHELDEEDSSDDETGVVVDMSSERGLDLELGREGTWSCGNSGELAEGESSCWGDHELVEPESVSVGTHELDV